MKPGTSFAESAPHRLLINRSEMGGLLDQAATMPRIGFTMDNLAVAALLALAPILLAGILLIGFRWPAKYAMPIGLVAAALVANFAWQIDWVTISASVVQGLLTAIGLLWIVFG
ncbi:MAG: L-lactate permease, partial [Brevibacterium aurantiacum]